MSIQSTELNLWKPLPSDISNKHYVYSITNLVNQKHYVGITSDYNRRKNHFSNCGSSDVMQHDMKVYGSDNFKMQIIHVVENKEQARVLEGQYILKYKSLIPDGYNVSLSSCSSTES